MSQPGQEVEFQRDCDVVRVPSGESVRVSGGTRAVVTQFLGGTFTLQIPSSGALVRLDGSSADAIGLEPVAAPAPAPAATAGDGGDLEEQVWAQLRSCYDPEIPVNIVDLGLIYDLRVEPAGDGGRSVGVKMTLTAQGCGMGTVIASDAEEKIRALEGVSDATVEIVWDPPWNPNMISQAGREKLGM